GVVLGKDPVRAALFPGPALDYSHEQDDLCMAAVYEAARYILRTSSTPVIIDGRTFLRACQVRDLLALAAAVGYLLRLIECVCADEVARERLARDQAQGTHPAGNRTYALYLARNAAASGKLHACPHSGGVSAGFSAFGTSGLAKSGSGSPQR